MSVMFVTEVEVGLTHVVKDGTQDKSHCRVTEKLEEGQTRIGLESPESSLETKLDLLSV